MENKAFNPMEHMMNLKGKQYLQVMWRLVWFREDHPMWDIRTELIEHDEENHVAIFRATISDENRMPKSSGYGSESAKDFHDYIEKAETKSVGRALAMLGYGTQFAPELDEEERIVDSPVEKKQFKKAPAPMFAPKEVLDRIEVLVKILDINREKLCEKYKVDNLAHLSNDDAVKLLATMEKKVAK